MRSIVMCLVLLASRSAKSFQPIVPLSALRCRMPPKKIRCLEPPSMQLFSTLGEDMRNAYSQKDTDGILEWASTLNPSSLEADIIVKNVLNVSDFRNGDVASMLNAWIGSCCLMDDKEMASILANDLFLAFEDLHKTNNISPDIVTYSLLYSALYQNTKTREMADYAIDQAARQSKKLAGGKRRKALAASRRKKSALSVKDIEVDLKQLCGPELSILYETPDLFVVNKPSGVSCFHRKTTTAGKIRKGKGGDSTAGDIGLEDALLSCNVPLSTINPEALGLVHRLDRGTSGCLVMAKTDEMHALLVSEFFLRQTQKIYTTLVSPSPAPGIPTEGTIDLPVDGRPAKSSYRIRERFGDVASLLDFEIHTGRKHQIRVHAAKGLSSPVYMDNLYGDSRNIVPSTLKDGTSQRFMLHAAHLRIPNYGIDVQAPRPKWWEEVFSEIALNAPL